MTRLAILADVHGNLPALEAVMADLARFAVDHVVVAGDLINLGPFPAEVVDAVLEQGWSVIRGNHEYYLLDYQTARAPAAWSDPLRWSMVRWSSQRLGEQRRRRIATWPDTLSLRFPDGPPILVVHGVPRSPWTGIGRRATDEEIGQHLADVAEPVVVVGHTHLTMDRRVGPWQVLNPGSLGDPLDGISTASYLLLESNSHGWQPQFRRVPYDRARLFAECDKQGYVETCGVIGHFAVEEFKTARPEISPFLRWYDATCPDRPLTMDLLAEYAAVDRWAYRGPGHRVNLDLPSPALDATS
ncbi:MAG TPA: metallophosphoesterase family protein [Chloroflexota bacterium]|nr:metallophosphoesterase family protein [Chloroflexota bacterium]